MSGPNWPVDGLQDLEDARIYYTPAHMRPGPSTPRGSKASLTRLVNAASPPVCASNAATDARSAAGARIKVACPPQEEIAPCTAAAPTSSVGASAAQTRPPAQS